MEDESLETKIDELLFWTKFSVWRPFTSLVKNMLKDDVEKLVYELSDGNRSTREIAKIISKQGKKISHVTIANLWQKWNDIPMMLPGTRKGRYKKVVSIKTLGMDIPELKNNFEE